MPINVSQQSWLPRRPSVSTHTTRPPKGKGPSLDGPDSTPLEFGSRYAHSEKSLLVLATRSLSSRAGADNFASRSSESATACDSSHSAPLRSQYSSFPSRHRTSFLSDAFSFRKKIGSVSRRKPNLHALSHTNNVVPDVIEINARGSTTVTSMIDGTTAHRDYEHEERERLRDVAAQSIGLDPDLLHDSARSESRLSLDFPHGSSQSARIPPFPATLTALRPFAELSSTLLKFTPPSSLLVYALAKQWKQRIIVLTHSSSQKTHVHLFKGSSKDERELERLEVTENSVIFVSEEEVGGRGNVVKFAGKDVSVKRNGANGQETLHTMWFLQIADPAESQRWIAVIKNAVLTQRYGLSRFASVYRFDILSRAVRAGLGIPSMNGENEPKGDMDVMLSMHLQGLISTHPPKPSSNISFPSSPVPPSPSRPSSLRSFKINIPSPSSPSSAIKGIFSGTRSRSPSVEGSPTSPYPHKHTEDSFGVAGTSLLTMLRTKSSAESSSSLSHALPVSLPHVSGEGSPAPSLRSANLPVIITASDLKISKERDAPELSPTALEASSSSILPGPSTPPTPSLSPQGALALSLQPPPRKCKHLLATVPASFLPDQPGMYKQASGNRSVAGNFGISSGGSDDVSLRDTPSVSPDSSIFSGGRTGCFSPNFNFEMQSPYIGDPHGRKRSEEVAPTLLGNEIINSPSSHGRIVPSDKLLHSSALTKRWSRQGVPLPKQLTPPKGPPPSIPLALENDHRSSMESSASMPVTYTTDRSSPISHNQARFSSKSSSSLSPTFWKRASVSSTHSVGSTNTFDSRCPSQMVIPLDRERFDPLSRSTVGRGASSRPMSLLAPVSSSVGYTATMKRRSMPPPRPAPKFAPPPAPAIQESTSERSPLMSATQKSFRSSIAQRALGLSLTSPKPPPSAALPPRPDEAVFAPGHRRSSSTGTTDLHPISTPSSRPASALSGKFSPIEPVTPSLRSLSIKRRLRILSTPPTSPPAQSPSFFAPSLQVSTLDLSDDNDDDEPPTPSFHSPQPLGLGEQIMTMQHYPNFLQLSTPVAPTAPKSARRSTFRSTPPLSGSLRTPSLEPDHDFVALSPPPRRGSKTHTAKRPERLDVDRSAFAQGEESRMATVSQRGSYL